MGSGSTFCSKSFLDSSIGTFTVSFRSSVYVMFSSLFRVGLIIYTRLMRHATMLVLLGYKF